MDKGGAAEAGGPAGGGRCSATRVGRRKCVSEQQDGAL